MAETEDTVAAGRGPKLEGQEDSEENMCRMYNFVICVVIIGAICVFGLLGNLTSLCVLVKHKTETVTIFLLQSICVSDSLLLLTSIVVYCLPEAFAFASKKGDTSSQATFYVITVWPFAMMAHTLTIWLTLLVTFTRYGAVCRPQHVYKSQNMRSTRLQVLAVIVFSVVYNIPRFFEHQPLGNAHDAVSNSTANGSNVTELVYLGDNKMYQIVYSNVSYFAVMYIVPLCSLAYMNFKLISSLKAIHRKKKTMTGRGAQNDQITLCVIIIVCVFIVCQTPALVNQIFWATLSSRDCGTFHFYYTKLSDVLVVFNSACNIIIYCLCGKGFRTIFFEAMCSHCPAALCRCRGPKSSSQRDTHDRQLVPAADEDQVPLKEQKSEENRCNSTDAKLPNSTDDMNHKHQADTREC